MRALNLSAVERAELIRLAYAPERTRAALRARVIVLLADRLSWSQVMAELGCSRGFIARWLPRFLDARIRGLDPRHRGSRPRVVEARLRNRLVTAIAEHNAAGRPRHSTRVLAARFGVSHMTVHRLRHPPRRAAPRGAAG